MAVVYIVLPLALVIAIVAVCAFVWAARTGQFDDLQTPGLRLLHDEEPAARTTGSAGSERSGKIPGGPGTNGSRPKSMVGDEKANGI